MIEDIRAMGGRHVREIKKLQKWCKHEKHHRSRYMWAPGHFSSDVEICDWCGIIIKSYNEMTPLDQDIKIKEE